MQISDWINIIAAILVGGGTLFLGIMAWRTIRQNSNIQKAEKRERLLNEIKDWIFGIKDITLAPITEDNLTFRQFNIASRYGVPMSRAELLEIEIEKILKDQDLKEKVSKVAELLAKVMVLGRARHNSRNINENVIEAFPGYVNSVKGILSEIDKKGNKTGKSKEDVAHEMWENYIKELNNAETEVLGKIVSLKSDLLKR